MHGVARPLFQRLLVLAVIMWAGVDRLPARAADRLPADTNKIESLTPEQARTLVARVRRSRDVVGRPGLLASGRRWDGLALNGLKTLDAETAAVLAEFTGTALTFNGLKTLTPDVAAALAAHRGSELSLAGLATLTPDAAVALAAYRGADLSLNGLATLPPATAAGLAKFEGEFLRLDRVAMLEPEAALALAGRRAKWLHLPGLTTLSAGAARGLAAFGGDGFTGQKITVHGLTSLTPDAALELARIPAWDGSLPRMTELTADVAAALAAVSRDGLNLGGLAKLTPETAAALAGFAGGSLYLGPTTLSPQAAAALGKARCGALVLNVQTIETDVAAELAKFPGRRLEFNTLQALEPGSAAQLAGFQGDRLGFGRVATLSPEAVQALAAYRGADLYLAQPLPTIGGTIPLTPDSARLACACARGRGVMLPGITALDTPDAIAAAKILATITKPLSLPGLCELSPAAAELLAGSASEAFHLGGLNRLTPEAARSLAAYSAGVLHLDGLADFRPEVVAELAASQAVGLRLGRLLATVGRETPLNPDVARLVSRCGQKDGAVIVLPGITALDTRDAVEIAKALASVESPLSIPNLKRLSPKTLSALIEKQDIDIPRIDTLDMIPEPDGSATDDVVIPEEFLQRQRQRPPQPRSR